MLRTNPRHGRAEPGGDKNEGAEEGERQKEAPGLGGVAEAPKERRSAAGVGASGGRFLLGRRVQVSTGRSVSDGDDGGHAGWVC